MLRKFVLWQQRLSAQFDRKFLSQRFLVDGNTDYRASLVPKYLKRNLKIVDVGGGRTPVIALEKKLQLKAHVVGVDIDENELLAAPEGVYDEIVCGDISLVRGSYDADLLLCQTVLEHVENVDHAFQSLRSFVKDDGDILLFVPSRKAVFARLNLLLPHRLKAYLLELGFSGERENHAFPAHYDRCMPGEFRKLANKHGFEVIEQRFFYSSTYFSFFLPLHMIWRAWIVLYFVIARNEAAETFSMVLRPIKLVAEPEAPKVEIGASPEATTSDFVH